MSEDTSFIEDIHHRRNVLPVIKDVSTGWYKGWYFDLRFREECDRALRYDLPMSLICVRLRSADDAGAVRQTLVQAGPHFLRSADIPSQLNGRDFVLCLPHTDQDGAAVVMERLVHLLSEYRPTIGRATFPQDGKDAESLLDHAFNRALYGRPMIQ
jgi:GGDEF domain-containing protein